MYGYMENTHANIRTIITKHQRIIMLTVAVVALAAYIVPFGHLYDVADAQKYKPDNNKKPDNKKKVNDKKSSIAVKIGLAQSAVINSGIVGKDGFQLGNTAFNTILQNQQVCSGFSICSNSQLVDFRPYTISGP
jgi:uncharacterized protein YqhQ